MQLDLPLTHHDMSGRGEEDAIDVLLAQSAARSGGAGGLDNDGRLVRLRVLHRGSASFLEVEVRR